MSYLVNIVDTQSGLTTGSILFSPGLLLFENLKILKDFENYFNFCQRFRAKAQVGARCARSPPSCLSLVTQQLDQAPMQYKLNTK